MIGKEVKGKKNYKLIEREEKNLEALGSRGGIQKRARTLELDRVLNKFICYRNRPQSLTPCDFDLRIISTL